MREAVHLECANRVRLRRFVERSGLGGDSDFLIFVWVEAGGLEGRGRRGFSNP